MPPKFTPVAPDKLIPVIVISAPGPADEGEKLLMDGAGAKKVNPALTAESVAVRTLTKPVAPLPTMALIRVPVESVIFEKEVAATPPNRTCEAFTRLFPLMTTVCPVVALVGEKEVMVVAG